MATTSMTIPQNLAAPKRRAHLLTIAARTLSGARLPLGYGVFYAVALAILIGLLYPTMSKLNLDAYLSSSIINGVLGAKVTHISSYTSLMAIELYSALYGLIFGGIIAYIAGAALPATFENGTLDLALARPISRTRYYLEMWIGALIASVILSVLTVVAVWIGSLFVQNAGIDWQWLIITQALEFAFMVMGTGLGTLFGSFMNGSRSSGGAVVGILFLFYMMNTIGGMSDKLQWMLKIEPFYYTQGFQALVNHDITGWYPWVLVAAGLVFGLVGLVIFNRRDLPTT